VPSNLLLACLPCLPCLLACLPACLLSFSPLSPLSPLSLFSQVRVCCFDKTGTLTKGGMDLHGVRLASKGTLADHSATVPSGSLLEQVLTLIKCTIRAGRGADSQWSALTFISHHHHHPPPPSLPPSLPRPPKGHGLVSIAKPLGSPNYRRCS